MAFKNISILFPILKRGFIKGLRGCWFIVKITVPVSLAVSLLNYAGVLQAIAGYCKPAMGLLGLPGEAVFPLICGAALNVYSGIAAMTSLPGVFTLKTLNIVAVMVLICHNLIIEGAIQKKTGISAMAVTFARIAAALIAGICMNLLIRESGQLLYFTQGAVPAQQLSLPAFLLDWSVSSGRLVLKIFIIIMTIMVLYEFLHHYRVMRMLSLAMRPIMRVLSLSPDVAFIWLASTLVGLAYGGGIIISEVEKNTIARHDLVRLHLSIGISHSLLEDTLLFLVIGATLFWLVVPRVALAILAVQAGQLFLRRSLPPSTGSRH
jgi:spore maturation protein SpmB